MATVNTSSNSAAANSIATDNYITAALAEGRLQICPRGCLVEKNGGCNYIECKCGVAFCWYCRRPKGTTENECPPGAPGHDSH
jgi:hypothetical protein